MFRDFSNFEVEDFAFDESFQKWVKDADSDHREFWEQYMREHPYQIDKVLAARELVLQLSVGEIEKDHAELAGSIWTAVEKHLYTSRLSSFRKFSWMYAAAIALLLLAGGYWYSRPEGSADIVAAYEKTGSSGSSNAAFIEKVNRGDTTLRVVLEDGSTVSLEKNSRLRYPAAFGSRERTVYLDGEAFFDVEKDPKHPFVVFTVKTVVKVLGTSFRVRAHDHSEKVVVSVRSGKVSVYERKDFENVRENPQVSGLVLMANQQAEFSNELEKFSKMIVPDPEILGNTHKKEFDFDQTPLNKVFETLEKAYGIEIIVDRELLADRRLKVSLEDETLTEKLDVICQTMGLAYQIVDARIIIENQ